MNSMRVWLSSRKLTVGVTVVDGIVVDAAPVVRGFIGRRLEILAGWMRRQGELRIHDLSEVGVN